MEKAPNQTRTDDPFITSEVLYQLSYRSNEIIISKVFCFGNDFFIFLQIEDAFLWTWDWHRLAGGQDTGCRGQKLSQNRESLTRNFFFL